MVEKGQLRQPRGHRCRDRLARRCKGFAAILLVIQCIFYLFVLFSITSHRRRDRLDRGVLGVVTLSVSNTREAVDLLRLNNVRGLTQTTAREGIVEADTPEIPVGVDGESLLLRTPVRCTVHPGALRVLVPRDRPGVRVAAPVFDWVRLWRTAFPS